MRTSFSSALVIIFLYFFFFWKTLLITFYRYTDDLIFFNWNNFTEFSNKIYLNDLILKSSDTENISFTDIKIKENGYK